jgi:hypothetical protein
MNRTRIIFFVVLAIALLIVGASLLLSATGGQPKVVLPTPPAQVSVSVVTALPVEPFVRDAAKAFNDEQHRLEGSLINVSIVPMDGLVAMGRWDRDEMSPIPTAWIPESRYLVELVNAAYKERLGRDVFLSDGEYRARPIATSLFAWGIYASRAKVLQAKYGVIDWQAIHDAAISKGGWRDLGGQADWGYFKLVVPNPRKNVGGLLAMVAAAGGYFKQTNVGTAQVGDATFQAWLKELMGAVTDFSSLGAYSVENLALFGYSMGDGGQLLESDLLTNMAGIQTRWQDPLVIVYPEYLSWFDFPLTVWMGPETSALEKNAALEFERYLLSPDVQKKAVLRGLRPANPEVAITGPDSPFVKWKDQGVLTVVPRSSAIRFPDRDVLLALLRWFDLNVAQK